MTFDLDADWDTLRDKCYQSEYKLARQIVIHAAGETLCRDEEEISPQATLQELGLIGGKSGFLVEKLEAIFPLRKQQPVLDTLIKKPNSTLIHVAKIIDGLVGGNIVHILRVQRERRVRRKGFMDRVQSLLLGRRAHHVLPAASMVPNRRTNAVRPRHNMFLLPV